MKYSALKFVYSGISYGGLEQFRLIKLNDDLYGYNSKGLLCQALLFLLILKTFEMHEEDEHLI